MGRAKSRKRVTREQREALEGLRTRMEARGFGRREEWGDALEGGKLSERLIELVRDEMDRNTGILEANVLICMSGIAWNLAVEPEIGEGQRKGLVSRLPEETWSSVDAMLARLKARKLALYPEDSRIVGQAEAHLQSDGGLYFTAASFGYDEDAERMRKPA